VSSSKIEPWHPDRLSKRGADQYRPWRRGTPAKVNPRHPTRLRLPKMALLMVKKLAVRPLMHPLVVNLFFDQARSTDLASALSVLHPALAQPWR